MKDLSKWKKASKIAAQSLEFGKSLIKKDASLLEVTQKTEKKIFDLGAKPAFPVQISMNHVAAHYCPDLDDETKFSDQLVKIDVGVHVDGCVGDNAASIDLSGKNTKLVEASQKALEAAIKVIKPNISLAEIGQAIQDVITSYGFSPIKNLSGHGLEPFDVHAPPTIPNFNTGDKSELAEGMIIAIEPFATTGSGMVIETTNPTVFSLVKKKPLRIGREILDFIVDNYEELPFAKHWLQKEFPKFKVNLALKHMLNQGIIRGYPPLVEKERGLVSQAEHTVMIKEKPIILTKV